VEYYVYAVHSMAINHKGRSPAPGSPVQFSEGSWRCENCLLVFADFIVTAVFIVN